jgi:hypothetical protein
VLRKFALLLSSACLILLGVLTIGCGSSSKSSSSACTGGPYNVVGNWDIDISNDSPNLSEPGVINSSGLAVFENISVKYNPLQIPSMQFIPNVIVMPSITGACSFSGNGTDYAFDGSSSSFSVTGKVSSDTSISGTMQTNGYSVAPISPFNESVVILPSSMNGTIQGTAVDDLTLAFSSSGGSSNSMTVSGSDSSGCTVSGTLNQEGSSNVFDVSIAISGSECPLTSLNGLGFESDWDVFNMTGSTPGVYMYVISSSSDEVLEIYQASAG